MNPLQDAASCMQPYLVRIPEYAYRHPEELRYDGVFWGIEVYKHLPENADEAKEALVRAREPDIVADMRRRSIDDIGGDFGRWNACLVLAAEIGLAAVCELLLKHARDVDPYQYDNEADEIDRGDELETCCRQTHAAIVAAFANGSHEAARVLLRYSEAHSGWLDTYMKPQDYDAVRAACSRGRRDMVDVFFEVRRFDADDDGVFNMDPDGAYGPKDGDFLDRACTSFLSVPAEERRSKDVYENARALASECLEPRGAAFVDYVGTLTRVSESTSEEDDGAQLLIDFLVEDYQARYEIQCLFDIRGFSNMVVSEVGFSDRTLRVGARLLENSARRNELDLSLSGRYAHPRAFSALERIGRRDLASQLLPMLTKNQA